MNQPWRKTTEDTRQTRFNLYKLCTHLDSLPYYQKFRNLRDSIIRSAWYLVERESDLLEGVDVGDLEGPRFIGFDRLVQHTCLLTYWIIRECVVVGSGEGYAAK